MNDFLEDISPTSPVPDGSTQLTIMPPSTSGKLSTNSFFKVQHHISFFIVQNLNLPICHSAFLSDDEYNL